MEHDESPPGAIGIEHALRALGQRSRQARLHRCLNRAAGFDLDRSAYLALAELAEAGPMPLSVLADSIGLEVSTVSRLVDRLKAAELVTAARSPSDQRVVVLSLTEAGAAGVSRLRAVRRAALAEILADWEPADRQTLATLLLRFVASIDRVADGSADSGPASGATGRKG